MKKNILKSANPLRLDSEIKPRMVRIMRNRDKVGGDKDQS
jgi:hypothetical protein